MFINNRLYMKKIISIGLISAVTLLLAPLANASVFSAGPEFRLKAGEISQNNLYAVGGNILSEGDVFGDLLSAGGNIIVSGRISKDLTAAGGNLNISGTIGEDLRIAGGSLVISGLVNGDLVAGGGSVNLTSKSNIKGDVRIGGGQIIVDGKLDGPATLAGGEIEINGQIGGNINIETQKLKIGKDAVINGNLTYRSPSPATIAEGAKINGAVVYDKTSPVFGKFDKKTGIAALLAFIGAVWFTRLLAVTLSALVFFLLFKKTSEKTVKNIINRFGKNILLGFAVLILVPIAFIAFLITVLGVPLGILLMLGYAITVILSGVFSGMALGPLIYKLFGKKDAVLTLGSAITGVIVMNFIRLIPFIGWLFYFVFFLAAMGAIWNMIYERVKAK